MGSDQNLVPGSPHGDLWTFCDFMNFFKANGFAAVYAKTSHLASVVARRKVKRIAESYHNGGAFEVQSDDPRES